MTTYKPKNTKTTDVGKLPYKQFEKAVDMGKLYEFLAEDPNMQTFLDALHDPGYRNTSFVTICQKFAIPLSRLQTIYTDGMRHIGLMRMSTALPEIMEHVAEDAKSRDIPCPRCDGMKVIIIKDIEKPCHVCHEKGTVRIPGDKHARDLVFESMKLTNQNVPMVAIQQNFNSPDDENVAVMFKKTQEITVGSRTDASSEL